MPNEEKHFTQYFMPYSEIGVVKNATKDLAINLEVSENEYQIMVYASGIQGDLIVELLSTNQLIFRKKSMFLLIKYIVARISKVLPITKA